MKRIHLSGAVVYGIALAGCGHSSSAPPAVVARGSRTLAMDTNDAAADFSFNQGFAAAQAIGVSAGTLHIAWNTDEGAGSGANSGTFTDTFGALASANAYYSSLSPPAKLSLTIAPIDTAGSFLPSDLSGSAMNSANVIARFNKFVDWVLSSLPNTSFTSIQIGNEIDLPAGASSSGYWSQYLAFLNAAVAHLHSAKPGVKIGVTVTLYGLIGQGSNGQTAKNGILALLSFVDELGLTYYPLDANFNVKNPSAVAGDFAQVFALVGSTPVYVQEAGYPTSSSCGSTEALQASFIDQLFGTWDTYAGQIPFLSLLRLNDYSASKASATASGYGLAGNAAFVAYLQTLGLRSYSAPSYNKAAWTELQARTHERGWW